MLKYFRDLPRPIITIASMTALALALLATSQILIYYEIFSSKDKLDNDFNQGAGPNSPSRLNESSRLSEIRSRRNLKIAVLANYPPFASISGDGRRIGLDIDIAEEFSFRWTGVSDVFLIEVIPLCRIPALTSCEATYSTDSEKLAECKVKCEEGIADIAIAALTRKPDRERVIAFSHNYFRTGVRLAIRADKRYKSLCDLEGKTVAVTKETTAKEAILNAAQRCGVNIQVDDSFPTDDEARRSVDSGASAAFGNDEVLIRSWESTGRYKLIGPQLSLDNYGIGVGNNERELLELINATLYSMDFDGTLRGIFCKNEIKKGAVSIREQSGTLFLPPDSIAKGKGNRRFLNYCR